MFEFKLPEIGEGVIEGEIVRWLRSPGESVDQNQALVEVMTDKATVEVPSPVGGVLKEHRAAEGDICAIGSVLCLIEQSAGAAKTAPAAKAAPPPAPSPAAAAPTKAAPPATPARSNGIARPASTPSAPPSPVRPAVLHNPAPGDAKVLATPAARHLARSSNIDLQSIPMDERGRITKKDVLSAQQQPARPASAPPSTPAPVVRPAAGSTAAPETIPFRGLRRIIAESMVRSYTTAVHYTYVEEVDCDALVDLRNRAKKSAKEAGISLSYLPFIIKAVCHALKKYPIINAHLDEQNSQIVLNKEYHIGMAAATDQGLKVPVIRYADQLSLLDLGREIRRLGEGAKNGGLAREELSGSTFTITSLGVIGGVLATPILNHPEVGILGVHALRKQPVVNDKDEVVVGYKMNLSTSFDHRIVDGFEGASFLQEVKRYLEDPTLLLLAGV